MKRDNEWVVGIFEHKRRSGRVFLIAYVRDYNPDWDGCCVHRVIAEDGAMAKDSAKAAHRREFAVDSHLLITGSKKTLAEQWAEEDAAEHEVG